MNDEYLKTHYIIYDGRAMGGDTDDASIFECCDTLREARRRAPHYGGCVIMKVTWNEEKSCHEETLISWFDADGKETKMV